MPDEAVKLLREQKAYFKLFEVLMAQCKLKEALEVVDKIKVADTGVDPVWVQLRIAQVHYSLGTQAKGKEMLEELAKTLVEAERSQWELVVATEYDLGLKEEAFGPFAAGLPS